jgi:hypothetical protein
MALSRRAVSAGAASTRATGPIRSQFRRRSGVPDPTIPWTQTMCEREGCSPASTRLKRNQRRQHRDSAPRGTGGAHPGVPAASGRLPLSTRRHVRCASRAVAPDLFRVPRVRLDGRRPEPAASTRAKAASSLTRLLQERASLFLARGFRPVAPGEFFGTRRIAERNHDLTLKRSALSSPGVSRVGGWTGSCYGWGMNAMRLFFSSSRSTVRQSDGAIVTGRLVLLRG